MTVKELYREIEKILADIPDGSFDADCIMEDIGGFSKEVRLAYPERNADEAVCARVVTAARKRALGYPLQYILGRWEFYGMPFMVGEGVLIPRPDTETLAEEVIKRINAMGLNAPRIIDLCSGSGCIAVAAAKNIRGAVVYAAELSGDAFPYLSQNVRLNGANVRLIRGDVMNGALMDNFRNGETGETNYFDCIVSNPPYLTDKEMHSLQTEVTYEPDIALYGGIDGLNFYRVISCLWKEVLRDGGLLIFEIGSEQEGAVKNILSDNGFEDIFSVRDAGGNVRVAGGYKCAGGADDI